MNDGMSGFEGTLRPWIEPTSSERGSVTTLVQSVKVSGGNDNGGGLWCAPPTYYNPNPPPGFCGNAPLGFDREPQ